MLKDLIKYFVALAAVSVGFYYASQMIFDDASSQSQTLSNLWRDDVNNLSVQKVLPIAIQDLREIEWVTPDKQARLWAKYLRPPFTLKPQGQYRLELLVLSQNEESLIAIIQHHLIHISSGNSVWELARTYKLPRP